MSTTNPKTPQGRASRMVTNFVGTDPIEIEASYHPDADIAATVSMISCMGPLSFQHTMKPSGAREMAAKLIELAEFAEALEFEADVLMAEVSL